MEKIKKYILPAAIVTAVILLILIRNCGNKHFRYDAERHAEASYTGSNLVSPADYERFRDKCLFVLLTENNEEIRTVPPDAKSISIAADSILNKKYTSILRKNKEPLILCCNNIAVSSRVWMILSQTGIKNLYIWVPRLNEADTLK